MSYEFKLPDLGEGVVEGEIVRWLVAEGDTVTEDQPLLEIMTDKATVDIPSPKAGTVAQLNGAEGDVVEVGDTLVVLNTGGGAAPKKAPAPKAEKAPEAAPKAAAPKAKAAPAAARTAPTANDNTPPATLQHGLPTRTTSPLAGRIAPATASQRDPDVRVLAAPTVRKKARELGLDITRVPGSGPGGRITGTDVTTYAQGGGAPSPAAARGPAQAPKGPPYNLPPGVDAPPPGGENRIKFKGMRRVIAKAMHQSKSTAAHFTFVEEVDMSRLVAVREELKPVAAAKGVKLNYLPFFVKASCIALERHPQLNITLDEEAGELVYRGYFNIGIAAATDRGLMVPVVKDAGNKSLVEIGREIAALGEGARAGSLKPDELKGSTFTITSLGQQGGLFATPVINFPEVAIMGIHQMKDKPVIREGQIVPGKVMLLSLSFDHRLVDGHVGAAFAYEVIDLLENPSRLLAEF